MKKKLKRCDNCKEESSHSIKKRLGTNKSGAYIKRVVEKCNECGKTIVNNKKRGTYTKILGGAKR